ncbi:MAG: DNA mismatch repair protein MutS [Oscillospiraceae bacterium]|nr:DNA mismatch repair protein MutS [Oscillospiraceae bacterium]MCL2278793.1 DNA mismatch repair protein MutS [Oscillospiraceae bacterium]
MTPMMRQYLEIKEKNPDSILFFRLGDFYEMFGEDAKTASHELDIVLTTRDKSDNPDERTPMCGVPYHSAESYIAKLISKGYKVAICEQLEDPREAKGIVARDVVRTISPGTLMDSSMLDESKSNYLCAVYLGEVSAACFSDLSTGEISVTEFSDVDLRHIENELASFSPSEAILGGNPDMVKTLAKQMSLRFSCLVQCEDNRFNELNAKAALEHFTRISEGSHPPVESPSHIAVGALFSYLTDTQKTDISHLKSLCYNNEFSLMEMDITTMRNLELVASLRTGDKRGSLLGVLDHTKTPMGRRLIRGLILRPLLQVSQIMRRQSAVDELYRSTVARGELILSLKKIGDMQRLIGKIVFGNAGCRDMKALSISIAALPELVKQLEPMKSAALRQSAKLDSLSDIAKQIDFMLRDDPPFSVREGGFINDGVDPELDRLRLLLRGSSEALTAIEAKERERTGKKLKIGYNKVFGYYIEISRGVSENVPDNYIRKQTLTNCERFITEELKELETELLTAKDSITTLEYNLFEKLRNDVAAHVGRIQDTAKAIAELDVFCSLAHVAVTNNYSKPEIDASGIIDIKDGRHPVVEVLQQGSLFVPNDTFLDKGKARTSIITGPNMAGKSTYMRQTALIVLMAQMGSFVPASSAQIGIVDRVFTRIGASDDLAAGMSTFMVEMTEVSDILSDATASSLLILDEIGRGTSTYDGMSVARAVLEHCTDKKKLGAKTMFATHYHELTILEDEIDGVINYNISAKKRGDEIIFLRKIVPGGADDSYGIEVAGLAGVPDSVIKRAKAILKTLEDLDKNEKNIPSKGKFGPSGREEISSPQISMLDIGINEATEKLRSTDLNTITPLEALSLLFEMKKLL